jgi:hypothetical protein
MLPCPLLLGSAEVCEALVIEAQQAHLLQVGEIDSPPTPKVTIKPIGEEIPQHLLSIFSSRKPQRRINCIFPERQIQNLKHSMTELVVSESHGASFVNGLVQ